MNVSDDIDLATVLSSLSEISVYNLMRVEILRGKGSVKSEHLLY